MSARWYVVKTQLRQEDKAAFQLRSQGYEVFLPKCRTVVRHARKTETVARPLFPSYIFVRLDIQAQAWYRINNTRGVAYLIQHNERPSPVPNNVIEELKTRADKVGVLPLHSLDVFKQGEALEITEGNLKGHIGEFTSLTEDERVTLMLSMLGKEVNISLPFEAVRAV